MADTFATSGGLRTGLLEKLLAQDPDLKIQSDYEENLDAAGYGHQSDWTRASVGGRQWNSWLSSRPCATISTSSLQLPPHLSSSQHYTSYSCPVRATMAERPEAKEDGSDRIRAQAVGERVVDNYPTHALCRRFRFHEMAVIVPRRTRKTWIVDSGADAHCANDLAYFKNYHVMENRPMTECANG